MAAKGVAPPGLAAEPPDVTRGAMAKTLASVAVAVTGAIAVAVAGAVGAAATPIRVMLLDGANNHDWKSTSPVIRKVLDEPGIFTTKTITIDNAEVAAFKPDWSQFDVVVLNYNTGISGDAPEWPAETKRSFERY